MKKALVVLSIMLLIGAPFLSFVAKALENNHRLFIYSVDEKLYYDSSLDTQLFAQHHNMILQKEYEDELKIENEAGIEFDIYLKISEDEDMEHEELLNLLEHISMTLWLDEAKIYEGDARGLDYDDVNLRDAIKLANFAGGEGRTLRVVWSLDEDYDADEEGTANEVVETRWTFYASMVIPGDSENMGNASEILPNPNTFSGFKWYWPVLGVGSVCGCLIVGAVRKKNETK